MNTNKLDAVETEVEVEVEFSDEVADEIDDDVYSEVTDADIAEPDAADSDLDLDLEEPSPAEVEAAGTAARAIAWFRSRNRSTAYQGYCERAVRLAWGRKTHHGSANKHWNSPRDGAQHRNRNAPAGAFVFWNISRHGHVGIADGNGGFWATSVNRRIGHATSLGYFRNYLGWKPGNSN